LTRRGPASGHIEPTKSRQRAVFTATQADRSNTIHRQQETHPEATNGFVILRKMELLPSKFAPKCRYQLDVYAGEQ
jgi:hypothetical protein